MTNHDLSKKNNVHNIHSLKIGIHTFHRCINYGSYWQARSLAEGLQARGHNATILDHDSRKINLGEWKCAYQPVLPTPVPVSDLPLYRKKIEKFFECFNTLPLSPKFPLDKPSEMENYDVVVVGSDEVWNLFHLWYGNYEIFFGEHINASKIISYAATFGNYPAAWGLSDEWAKRLRNFDAISVRDENSQWLVKNAIGTEPDMVLDPCLQFIIDPDKRPLKYTKPYIAVYGHNFSDHYINNIKRYAVEKKLPLISIGYRNDWADEQWITADPHDFSIFMSNATAVAANLFHGCVFSLRNAKPFVCETSPYRSNKLQGLMAKVGAEKHLVWDNTSYEQFDECLSNALDHQIITKIESLRETSNAYLDRALDINQLQEVA